MKVTWDSEKCQHSGCCVKSLPEVFKIEEGEFVIDTSKAPDEEIMEVVRQCPSQAFSVDD